MYRIENAHQSIMDKTVSEAIKDEQSNPCHKRKLSPLGERTTVISLTTLSEELHARAVSWLGNVEIGLIMARQLV